MSPLRLWATLGWVVLLTACATAGNSVGGAALGVETLADQIRAECGNTVPDGPCTEDSLITTAEKQGLKKSLQTAVLLLEGADSAIVLGDAVTGATKLRQADAVLEAITRWLTQRGVLR